MCRRGLESFHCGGDIVSRPISVQLHIHINEEKEIELEITKWANKKSI